MGIFDSLNLKKSVPKTISLRKEMVCAEAARQHISVPTARVVFALDHSGSMRSMYRDGTVQGMLERIFPVAMHFDDNAEMEFYWFDNQYRELEAVTTANLGDYVQRVILSKNEHFGGTCYAPIMEAIFQRYALREPMAIPTFVIFITDGSNSDKTATKAVLTEASKYNLFWKFVGIGNETFPFLERLDDLKGRFIDNANFISIADISSIDDQTLYAHLLTEYGDWLALCRQHGLLP